MMSLPRGTEERVLGLYTARTTEYAVDFLIERVLEELPFPIQCVQTDCGSEFFGLAFQQGATGVCREVPPQRAWHALPQRQGGA